MKLPQHPVLPYVGLLVVAYLSADLTAAVLERQFHFAPHRTAKAAAPPAQLNGITIPGELSFILSNRATGPGQTEPTPGITPVSSVSGAATVSAGNATALPTLTGTLEGQGQSLAVLQMGQETQVIGVGEEWLGYRVIEVAPFQARLRDARGQEYTISMQLANAGANGPTGPPLQLPQTPATTNPWAASNSTLGSPVMSSRELRSMLDDRGWIKNILVQPVLRENEPVGVQINYSSPDNPFPKLGILTGDIVMSLNNKPLRGMEDMSTVLMELRNSTSLNFQIERGGQVMPHVVTLQP